MTMITTYMYFTPIERIQREHWLNCEENELPQWDSYLARYKATSVIQLLSVFCFPEIDKSAETPFYFFFKFKVALRSFPICIRTYLTSYKRCVRNPDFKN